MVLKSYNTNYRADIYDIVNNSWKITGQSNIGRALSVLVTLGSRVFVLAGMSSSSSNTVEEYHYHNNSWTIASKSMIQPRKYFWPLWQFLPPVPTTPRPRWPKGWRYFGRPARNTTTTWPMNILVRTLLPKLGFLSLSGPNQSRIRKKVFSTLKFWHVSDN